MCGVVGLLAVRRGLPREDLMSTVGQMVGCLRHRGPDDEGVWSDRRFPVALGHRRLAVLDPSIEGHQPMVSMRWAIVFNGEIYNFRELRRQLETEGQRFRGSSDTEVVLAGFDHWGVEKTLRRCNGMFAIGAWDRRERRLHLVRDRLGEKPLYYGRLGKDFVFASELKAFRVLDGFPPPIDPSAIAGFLRHGYVQPPRSIYSGIQTLLPGHHLVLDGAWADGMPNSRPYWNAEVVMRAGEGDRFGGTWREAVDQLEDLLADAVRLRLESDVPIGAFLSGGIDSSLTVALMRSVGTTARVRTFTIGFNEAAYDEAPFARSVAESLGTEHVEAYVTPTEAQEVIPDLATIYDEPFADMSQIPTVLVSRLARRHVTVALSGDGGDELFGGYERYVWAESIWRHSSWLPAVARRSAAQVLRRLSTPHLNMLLRGVPWLGGRLSSHRLRRLGELMQAEDQASFYEQIVSYHQQPERLVHSPVEASDGEGLWVGDDLVSRMMARDLVDYLPNDLLVKVDRASMSVGLEARVPLLDHRIVEFAWRLPVQWRFRRDVSKWILRQVLYKHVPAGLVDRPKMGFAVPVGAWLRGPLRPWAEDLLTSDMLLRTGLLDSREVRRLWHEHLSGTHDWQYVLWSILMLQAWWIGR